MDGAVWMQENGEGVDLIDARGALWRVDGVVAWDADGDALPARVWVDGDHLRVEVDDSGAIYPIEVDPVYSTAAVSWTETSGALGTAVASADVNGDGYSDVLVSASDYNLGEGRVYVFHGSDTGPLTTADTTLSGSSAGMEFGGALASAGDVDQDGYDDVIIGAPGYSSGTGRAFVYHGSASGLTSATTTLTGPSAASYFGESVSGVGDVNGDDHDDIVIGAGGAGSGAGRAYVYMGTPSGVYSFLVGILYGTSNSQFGQSVSGAGDVNGDDYDDVIVGASGYNGGEGRASIHLGSGTGLTSAPATTLTGSATGTLYAFSVAGAGDVNGDGYDDVIIGEYEGGTGGLAYVHLGSASGIEDTAALTLSGENPGDAFGYRVVGLSDVDGDGYDDVGIGASGYDASAGRSYVHLGSAGGLAATSTEAYTGATAGDQSWVIGAAGDVNGDGADDILVGSPAYSPGGLASLYLGIVLDVDGDEVPARVDCDDEDAAVGAPDVR